MGSSFEANLDTLGSKILPNRTPNHGQSLSVSLKYLVNICTVMTKKTSRYHTAILPLCFKSSCQHMPKGTKSTKNDEYYWNTHIKFWLFGGLSSYRFIKMMRGSFVCFLEDILILDIEDAEGSSPSPKKNKGRSWNVLNNSKQHEYFWNFLSNSLV